MQSVLERSRDAGRWLCRRIESFERSAGVRRMFKVARIDDHVVTQSFLAETVNGSKQVRIGAKAILTPLGPRLRPHVRNRNHPRSQSRPESGDSDPLAVHRHDARRRRSRPPSKFLKDHGIACDLRLVGLPAEAAAQAISAICRGEAEKLVVFTNQPEVVACLANRNDRVRAAAIADVAAVERVQKTCTPTCWRSTQLEQKSLTN